MSKSQANLLDNLPHDIITCICELLPNDRNRINLLRTNKSIYSCIGKVLMHDPVELFNIVNNKYIDNFTHIKLFGLENNIPHAMLIDECIQINDLLNMHDPPIKFPANMITLELKTKSLNLLVSDLPHNIKSIKIGCEFQHYCRAKVKLVVPYTCQKLSIDNHVIVVDMIPNSVTHLTLKQSGYCGKDEWIGVPTKHTVPTKYIVPTCLTYLKLVGNVHINVFPKSLIELDISDALCSYADLDKMLYHDISKKNSYSVTKLHVDNINTIYIPDTVDILYIDSGPSSSHMSDPRFGGTPNPGEPRRIRCYTTNSLEDYKLIPKNVTTCIMVEDLVESIIYFPENVRKVCFHTIKCVSLTPDQYKNIKKYKKYKNIRTLRIPDHIMYVDFSIIFTTYDINIHDYLRAWIDNYDYDFTSNCTMCDVNIEFDYLGYDIQLIRK